MTELELRDRIHGTKTLINQLLREGTHDAYDRIYQICNAEDYGIQLTSDNDLIVMKLVSTVWKGETAYLDQTVYSHINLNNEQEPILQLRDLYTDLKLFLFRIENQLPEKFTEESIHFILQERISGDFLYFTAAESMENPEGILLYLGKKLVEVKEYAKAARIYALIKTYSAEKDNTEVIIAQTRMYIEIGNYAQAYTCLMEVKEANAEIEQLMKLLKPYKTPGKE